MCVSIITPSSSPLCAAFSGAETCAGPCAPRAHGRPVRPAAYRPGLPQFPVADAVGRGRHQAPGPHVH